MNECDLITDTESSNNEDGGALNIFCEDEISYQQQRDTARYYFTTQNVKRIKFQFLACVRTA